MDYSICDKHGIPICEGDLIRSPHFIGARNKMHYLYHVIVEENDVLYMVPTSHLVPSQRNSGGKCQLRHVYSDAWEGEIIHGNGPAPYISFEDRPRKSLRYRLAKEAAKTPDEAKAVIEKVRGS